MYYSWKLFDRNQVTFKDCFWLGVFAALGFLSKYLFFYLLLAIALLFFYIIFIKKYKKFNFKYLISVEVFIILLVPHLIWLVNNDYITITYGLARAELVKSNLLHHIIYPLMFLIKQTIILIPFFIMSFFLIKRFKTKVSLKDKKLLFLLSINLIPIGLMFLTSIFTGSQIRTMWMTPFYLFFGVLIVYIFQAQINVKKINLFLYCFVFLFILSPTLYSYISIRQIDKRTDYPGKDIAMKVQYVWNQKFNNPINIVFGNEWDAGNLSYHLESRPSWNGFVDQDKINKLNEHLCIDSICVGFKKNEDN